MLPPTTRAQDSKPKPKPSAVKVKRGLTLRVSLLTALDSAHTNVGDEVRAKLDRPLVAEGATILPADWILHGSVTKVKRAGPNCHDGKIELKPNAVTLPNGGEIRIQRVVSYPYDPNRTGDPEWVPLDTPLKKVARVPTYIGLTAFVVALSPLLIPMGIAMSEPCHGKTGQDQVLPAGSSFLFAVSKDVRALPVP